MKTPSDSKDPIPTDPKPASLASIAPEESVHIRWARNNIPGADRPGISASELADLCIRYARSLLERLDEEGK